MTDIVMVLLFAPAIIAAWVIAIGGALLVFALIKEMMR